jgi:putative membrane protein insertion efficiency factor
MPDEACAAPAALTIPQRIALVLLRAYQLLLSPLFAGSCRFVPSCSAYAVDAIARFGVLRGSLLAMRRLARCRPLAAHGFDPVPPAVQPHAGRGRHSGLATRTWRVMGSFRRMFLHVGGARTPPLPLARRGK